MDNEECLITGPSWLPSDWLAFTIALIVFLISAAGVVYYTTPARAHEARNTAGQPLDIMYPASCCNSAATHPTGDCAPIDDRYVTERADGYHVNIPVGGHPKLKTKGYVGVVPYDGVKKPLSNDYHICLSEDGGTRFCFFPKPGMS